MDLRQTHRVRASTTREPTSSEQVPDAPARWWQPAVLPGPWTPVLLGTIAALLAVHGVVNGLRLGIGDFPGLDSMIRWLDVDGEGGVPAWFSGIVLFLCAQGLWLLADASATGPRGRWAFRERVLAAAFVYLSLDELTQIHEQSIDPLVDAFGFDGVLAFAWVVLAVPLAAAMAVWFVPYLLHLPRAAALLMVLSGVLFVGGAAGVELVGAAIFSAEGFDTLRYTIAVAVEEGLEMLGAVLFLSVVTWLRTTGSPRPTAAGEQARAPQAASAR